MRYALDLHSDKHQRLPCGYRGWMSQRLRWRITKGTVCIKSTAEKVRKRWPSTNDQEDYLEPAPLGLGPFVLDASPPGDAPPGDALHRVNDESLQPETPKLTRLRGGHSLPILCRDDVEQSP
jgi:hypothetical protein